MLVFSSRDKHCRGNRTSFRLFDRARSLKASNTREARDFYMGEISKLSASSVPKFASRFKLSRFIETVLLFC